MDTYVYVPQQQQQRVNNKEKKMVVNGGGELWSQVGSSLAAFMFIWTMYQNYFPHQLRIYIKRYTHKFTSYFYPYIQITFHEFEGDHWYERSKAYIAIERYLGANSSSQAKRLKAKVVRDCEAVVLSMDDHEEVTDEYEDGGIKLWWTSSHQISDKQSISFYPKEDGKRYFKLSFHKKHRDVVTNSYLKHVLGEGKAISVRERQRKLFTNNKSESSYGGYRGMRLWNHVVFEHPATFQHLAMEPKKKQEIINDLLTFSTSKSYYAKIGKAWKRGYLLYGPPGTGKSTMIAAMANFLKYDVYDLELTSVKDNTELRRLLIDTSSKSIIVIEDIDCSLDLTGQREKKKDTRKEEDEKEDKSKNPVENRIKKDQEEKNKGSQVTLSGLLNCIDGLWSTCGEERIFIFTTNYVEKLDPALIRRGRMDKHIELSYCCFESFKVLANNYLDVEFHKELFPKIKSLLEETNMTPADVAENLMPKSADDDADACMEKLIKALEEAKEEAIKLKAEEDEKRLKAEEEERVKKAKEEEEEEEEQKKKKENTEEEVVKNKDSKENGDVKVVAEE